MIIKFLTALLFTICFLNANAQDLKKRYSFAKAYFGADINYVPSYGESPYLNSNNQIDKFQRNAFLSPAINFGATHFWGFADIYVSIPVVNLKLQADKIANGTSLGVSTGLRIYPLQLNDKKFRPFIGYKFSPFNYGQKQLSGEIFSHTALKSMLDIGLGYRRPNLYCYLAYNKVLNPNFNNYISRTLIARSSFPKQFIKLGVNLMIETTAGVDSKKARELHGTYSKKNKAGLFFGIGPSVGFQILNSPYNKKFYPFLDDKALTSIFPDMSVGYHFTKQDLAIALSYRPIKQSRSAYSLSQQINRNSLLLEAYKYLTDYHGFAPFIGGGLSYENLKLKEIEKGNEITNLNENKLAPVITFGWDIRPRRKSDTWLLRTNLRYSPSLNIENKSENLSLQHLEFNFIQFVLYPSRIKDYKRKNQQ